LAGSLAIAVPKTSAERPLIQVKGDPLIGKIVAMLRIPAAEGDWTRGRGALLLDREALDKAVADPARCPMCRRECRSAARARRTQNAAKNALVSAKS
jgi:hypothetical protein